MDLYDAEVIKSLRNNATVKKLLNHERNKLVINTKGAYYYKNTLGKYVLLTGLLPRLRKTFFPATNIFKLLNGKKDKKEKTTRRRQQFLAHGKPPEARVKPLKQQHGKGKFYGRVRGSQVHQEIEDFLFLDSKNFRKKHPTIHIYTRKILTFILDTMRWKLLRSEFDLFDEKLGIGTSVDILAVTEEGKLVLIEVKCGFTGYFDNHDGYMQRSLHKLSDSPHHQANLQLIAEALLIVKGHQISLDDMLLYVVRVDDQGLYHYKVNNEYVQKKGAKIYSDLVASMTA